VFLRKVLPIFTKFGQLLRKKMTNFAKKVQSGRGTKAQRGEEEVRRQEARISKRKN